MKTFEEANGTWSCINRDSNACNNMIKLVRHYLKYGTWLPEYSYNEEEADKALQAVVELDEDEDGDDDNDKSESKLEAVCP